VGLVGAGGVPGCREVGAHPCLMLVRDPWPQGSALEASGIPGRAREIDGGVEKAAGEIQVGDGKRRYFDRQRLLADGIDDLIAVRRHAGNRFHASLSGGGKAGPKRPWKGIGCGREELEQPSRALAVSCKDCRRVTLRAQRAAAWHIPRYAR